jgi:DNA primase
VGEDVETLKRRRPLLDYLRLQNWTGRSAGRNEFVGLCPLHEESRPSFYVNTRKNVFYCHGCGQGGDLVRFIELSRGLSFRQSLAYLDPEIAPEADSSAVLEQAAEFYQQQLDHCAEAMHYLNRRGVHDPVLIRELGIGYAPGGTLRRYLTAQGYSFELLRRIGLINARGADALYQRIVFPLGQNEHVNQPVRSQHRFCLRPSLPARRQGRPVCLGEGSQLLQSDPGRRTVRLCRRTAGGL